MAEKTKARIAAGLCLYGAGTRSQTNAYRLSKIERCVRLIFLLGTQIGTRTRCHLSPSGDDVGRDARSELQGTLQVL